MDSDDRGVFEITMAGSSGADWTDWLDGAVETSDATRAPTTVIRGSMDQATLRGILNRLWDLNLTLISVVRKDSPSELVAPTAEQEEA